MSIKLVVDNTDSIAAAEQNQAFDTPSFLQGGEIEADNAPVISQTGTVNINDILEKMQTPTESTVEVANDNQPADEVIQITPEQMEIQNLAAFCTLQMQQDPRTGELQMGIVQIPVPVDMINAFQEQMGAEMAKENMKFVVYKGKAFLAPVQTTSLIGFK